MFSEGRRRGPCRSRGTPHAVLEYGHEGSDESPQVHFGTHRCRSLPCWGRGENIFNHETRDTLQLFCNGRGDTCDLLKDELQELWRQLHRHAEASASQEEIGPYQGPPHVGRGPSVGVDDRSSGGRLTGVYRNLLRWNAERARGPRQRLGRRVRRARGWGCDRQVLARGLKLRLSLLDGVQAGDDALLACRYHLSARENLLQDCGEGRGLRRR